ncbi:MAG: nucleotidyltransferase domain-containing protein [Gemmataceae bacterium]|nr:nucleotidyltransferase domain-containing protein [Gemmataceae bacterium]
MEKKRSRPLLPASEQIYWGADVPMRVIRRFARAVGDRFHPHQIILFGSHAYGSPTADSDVDILVIMPARNKHSQAVKIRWDVPDPFPMDLLVRTPQEIARGLKEGDTFLTEVVSKGKILYENRDACVGAESQGRLSRRDKPRTKRSSSP